MPAPNNGSQGNGRREERRREELDGNKGVEGLPLYRGRGEALPLHQEGGGGALGQPPAPTNPLGAQPLGFGAPGLLSLGRPRLLLSLWAQIGPIVGAAQINYFFIFNSLK